MRTYKNTSHKQKYRKPDKKNRIKLKMFFRDKNFLMGLAFFILGSIVSLVFMSTIDFYDLKFSKKSPTTQGKITDYKMTNSYSNDKVVIKYYYDYTVNGKEYKGESCTTGKLSGEVDISYLENSPEISRIKGSTRGDFSPIVLLFTLMFPIIGIVTMRTSYRKLKVIKEIKSRNTIFR